MRISIIILSLLLLFTPPLQAPTTQWLSYAEKQWETKAITWQKGNKKIIADIELEENLVYQQIEGWGGCFNEKGWKALQYLEDAEREEIMKLLFSTEACNFDYCRMPIGASDYALDYYSLNDHAGDYKMENFSLDRDRKYLIPYLKAAMDVKPSLKIWGSPWTPPFWMKENNHYARGSIKTDAKTLAAYALYFRKYIKNYRKEGINIVAVHPQNEPLHLPAFPSCGWTGEQLKTFIGTYLGPELKSNISDCEIWLGTINGNDQTDEFQEYVQTVLSAPESKQYLTGVGYQWDGDAAVEQTIHQFPEMKIMQTETKCGWGQNDWAYAFQTFDQMYWYLQRKASYYLQWNMVLDETGMSSWGWKQNAMITVDTFQKNYRINPQYWVVRHFTQFIKAGAYRIGCHTKNNIQALAFKNSGGQLVLICRNPTSTEQSYQLQK
ncbi:glycoside hydrolase family 30 protein [Persicobacter diffluens]|uniref:Glycosyl hydrolase n=1 Tax=Persicobacter diffluens TaxID=981 RepID=A0AAN5AL86_9BACT|nr:glycosyl hydrolase [Persicobacter diffluens]